MTTEEIKELQRHIRDSYAPKDRDACDDGYWGRKSIAACQKHLRRRMPKVIPWPEADYQSMVKFYGRPGDERNLTVIEFPFPTFYGGKRVKTTRVHKRCAESLLRVLNGIQKGFGADREIMEEAEDYGGCYNFRNSRGSTTLSKHAWGAAIDYDADDNGFRDHWPLVADMPIWIMEEFALEGWISAGAFWGYDAMHFQATR